MLHVVQGGQFPGYLQHLRTDHFHAGAFQAVNDLSHYTALHPVGFYQHQCPFARHHFKLHLL